MKKSSLIDPQIKSKRGFDEGEPDNEVLKKWKTAIVYGNFAFKSKEINL